MDESTIAANIKQSSDKITQLGIEAQINGISKDDVRAICVNRGVFEPWTDERVQELYDQGMTDNRIGEKFGFSYFVVKEWRNKRGLSGNKGHFNINRLLPPKPSGHKSKIDDGKAMAMYNDGKSDKAIGEELGMSANAILHWRQKNGLESKRPKNVPIDTKTSETAVPEKIAEPVPKVLTCDCCSAELPTVNESSLYPVLNIKGNEKRLCAECSGVIEWFFQKQKEAEKSCAMQNA